MKDLPTKALVSVVMITYNHKDNIHKAIEGVLMQKTNFPFELIIGEDASTDGTREIVENYAKKFPGIIKILSSDKNLGMTKNYIRTVQGASGKYIALCEGDDYWTDALKLQKQVDFMNFNPECTLCYHAYQTMKVKPDSSISIGPKIGAEVTTNKIISGKKAIESVYARTVTILFRISVLDPAPEWIYKAPYGDYPLLLTCADKGSIGYLAGPPMAVYQRGNKGSYNEKAFGNENEVLKLNLKRLNDHFRCFDLFNEYTNLKYNSIIQTRKRRWLYRFLFYFLDNNNRQTVLKTFFNFRKELPLKLDYYAKLFWLRYILGEVLYKKLINKYPKPF
ncbi:glycosyltransferase [Aequorivita sp. KMM 9714]|uniref:glycosyltransferase n=1 Tax=Aequorivita sp. KMM 9714 TaxID=2707173 RepID=UPI0013EC77C4|nr:glycosyltransferase [Aequorivita sp. KMM 9714]NGX84743.1 glycosyltransferase [Aequorivita sp. KMM 9714]